MAKNFSGRIALDIRDSVPDWEPYLTAKAPEGAPNVLLIPGTTSASPRWTSTADPWRPPRCSASHRR